MNCITTKAVSFWIIGALLIFTGVWVLSRLELTIGVEIGSFVVMMIASFISILLGGLCWIYVSKRELK